MSDRSRISTIKLLKASWIIPIVFAVLVPLLNGILPNSGIKWAILGFLLILPFIGLICGVIVYRRQESVSFSKKFFSLFAGLAANFIFSCLVIFGVYSGVKAVKNQAAAVAKYNAQQAQAPKITLDAAGFVSVANENFKPPKELKPGWWIERLAANNNQVVTDVRNRKKTAKQLKLNEVKELSNPQAACAGAQNFIKAGVTFKYRYFDKKNKELYSFVISDAYCKNNKFY